MGSVATFAVAFALTGNIAISGSVAAADLVGRTALYYVHERLWAKVGWGLR